MQTEIHTTRTTVQYNRMTDIHPPTNYSYKTDPLRRVCAVGRESEGVQMGGYIQGKTLHESEIMMTDNTTDRPTDANVHVVTRGRPHSSAAQGSRRLRALKAHTTSDSRRRVVEDEEVRRARRQCVGERVLGRERDERDLELLGRERGRRHGRERLLGLPDERGRGQERRHP